MTTDLKDAQFRHVPFLPRDIDLEQRKDGTLILRSSIELKSAVPHVPFLLHRSADRRPDHPWLVQRRGPDNEWQALTYGQGRSQIQAATQFLLDLNKHGQTVMVLSENSPEHGVIEIAAMQAHMPYSPITTAYSLLSGDHEKLKAMAALLEPPVIFVQSGKRYERAVKAIDDQALVICVEDPIDAPNVVTWDQVIATEATDQVRISIDSIKPDTIAKYQFTSGSTGIPKAVIVTQRMLTVSLMMTEQMFAWEPGAMPETVLLEWLPWSHVAGGHSIFNCVLEECGTMYLDDGRPTPAEFAKTLRNLREVSPSRFSGVPVAYAMLVDALQKDPELGSAMFSNMQRMTYSGSRLPDATYEAMQREAIKYSGRKIPFVSAYGSTETSAAVTYVHWATDRTGMIGLPHPGVELKLVPLEDGTRYEIRVRSEAVTPGYLKNPELTAQAFDDEGFFIMGDAATFVDPEHPEEGMVFAGRVAEEFKLMSGIFVRVSCLKADCVSACAPLVRDMVITGADRPYVGALAWLNIEACNMYLKQSGLGFSNLVKNPDIRRALRSALQAHNERNPGSSMKMKRLWLLEQPASMDRGETNDKGYINQRKVLESRATEVQALYDVVEAPNLIVIEA
ncbi:AMP-binding protein [Paraburkholderia youngii]|uniref:AMP-binding protein n=1 Tax=Paraburkholderia youngii TaxID=2782701 RepID=UPI003D1A9A95